MPAVAHLSDFLDSKFLLKLILSTQLRQIEHSTLPLLLNQAYACLSNQSRYMLRPLLLVGRSFLLIGRYGGVARIFMLHRGIDYDNGVDAFFFNAPFILAILVFVNFYFILCNSLDFDLLKVVA